MAGQATLFPDDRSPIAIAPGAVLLPGVLDLADQQAWLAVCRRVAKGPAGLHQGRTRGGRAMAVETVSVGWHWVANRYERRAVDGDGAPVQPLPAGWAAFGVEAVRQAATVSPAVLDGGGAGPPRADAAVINLYRPGATMGLHVDADEVPGTPVVSISLGDEATFRFGNAMGKHRPWRDVQLRSGDVFVFGGPARLCHHGVPRVAAGTGPGELGLRGRINITLRVVEPPAELNS